MRESIGNRLRRLRQERGLSQRELGEPGVSYAYISRVEAGDRTPSEKALRMLAARLDVTVLFLETGSDEGVCPTACGRSPRRKRPPPPRGREAEGVSFRAASNFEQESERAVLETVLRRLDC